MKSSTISENQPKVTVLITAYNRERYIAHAIESVLAQTYTDFELIVVDDCSRDSTAAIAHEYEADPRVKVIVNSCNFGQFPNRNHAAKLAHGALLKYHDSDDIMYPHCLEVMVGALESEPRAGIALSGHRWWSGGPCPMLSTPRMSYQREFLGFGMFTYGPGCALFRTQVFHELGGFPVCGVVSDFLFWLYACASVNVLLVPTDLYWYRIHPQQELNSPSTPLDRANANPRVWEALNAPECPLEGIELAQAKRNWVVSVAKEVRSAAQARNWKLALYTMGTSGLSLSDWMRYLRRPVRSRLAGTPLDENGEYIIPEYLLARPRQALAVSSK